MATQISSAQFQVENNFPSTMRAVVYRGINDMRVETVPVPTYAVVTLMSEPEAIPVPPPVLPLLGEMVTVIALERIASMQIAMNPAHA